MALPENFYCDPSKAIDGLQNYERKTKPCCQCKNRRHIAWDIYGCGIGIERRKPDAYCKEWRSRA